MSFDEDAFKRDLLTNAGVDLDQLDAEQRRDYRELIDRLRAADVDGHVVVVPPAEGGAK